MNNFRRKMLTGFAASGLSLIWIGCQELWSVGVANLVIGSILTVGVFIYLIVNVEIVDDGK